MSLISERSISVNPQYFSQSGSLNEWPNDHYSIEQHIENVKEAETQMWWGPPSDAAAWMMPLKDDPPLSMAELKVRESRMHVDNVRDMVPFWIRGIEAAEKGEVLRLEEFLETLQEAADSWSGNAWTTDQADQGWGGGYDWLVQDGNGDRWNAGGWGAGSLSMNRAETSERHNGQQGREMDRKNWHISSGRPTRVDRNAHEFVEDVARLEEADEERKRRMHSFFDMPTDEKVRRIDQVIRDLHRIR